MDSPAIEQSFFFCGDSNVRQFYAGYVGNWTYSAFSGATIKGLGASASTTRLGVAIEGLAAIPIRKTMLVILGAADLNATFHRQLALGASVDERSFFEERAEIYADYVDRLFDRHGAHISEFCVLAPQLTPLTDAVFVPAVAKLANVDEDSLRAATQGPEFRHAARCQRQMRFNDTLERAFRSDGRVDVYRIDRKMAGEDGCILPEFIGPNPLDHHPATDATLRAWMHELQFAVPHYAKILRRERRTNVAAQDDEA